MKLKMPIGKQRDTILEIIEGGHRWNILDGSVRSGKTIGSLWAWCEKVRSGPTTNRMMIGKTERTLKRTTLDPLAEMVGDDFRLVQGSGECYLFGKRIYLLGANDERAETKLRGITLQDAYGDEISTWPQSFFEMLGSRLSEPMSSFIGTTNPDAPLHWLNTEYLQRHDELDMFHEHFTLDDNPNLDPTIVENLKREHRGLWYKRFILGLWVVAEGAIYDFLDPDGPIMVDHLPRLIRHWIGVDYGTTNPTVYIPFSLGEDGFFYVHHTWRWDSKAKGRQMTDAEYSKALTQHLANPCAQHGCNCRQSMTRHERIFVDPSAASFRLQLFKDQHTGITPANNEVLDGIRTTATLMESGLVKFHRPTTQDLLGEMVGYAWDPQAQKKGKDEPLKVNDHSPDAFRYVAMGTQHVWRRQINLLRPRSRVA